MSRSPFLACPARVVWCLVLLGVHGVTVVQAAEKTGFWLAVRSNTVIDNQVAEEVGVRAGMIALRAPADNPAPGYSFPDVAARLKGKAPNVPVVAYAQISRVQVKGRIETQLLSGLDTGALLAETTSAKGLQFRYIDVTNAEVRHRLVERLVAERTRLRVDGFAIDLANRTPRVRPRTLANICGKKPPFCDLYAKGMDDIFGKLNSALGEKGTLLYNGLWNFAPGTIEDQSQLLLHADAAAIEFFGMDPRERPKGFRVEVLPYLEALTRLPKGKPVLFFGRGQWRYMDYATDYRWQRYLYASFLLGRRPEDMFKYHTSFQIPPHAGRSGGLDVYADWKIDLGSALGPYRAEGGVYRRDFSGGLVLVAPDDGKGGRLQLAASYFTPDGQPLSGEVRLAPGEGLILLTTRAEDLPGPAVRRIDARKMASWGWAQAELVKASEGERLRLKRLPGELDKEHDLLLDYERSLAPFERLEINAVLTDPDSTVLAVAEVDDPRGESLRAVVAIGRPGSAGGSGQVRGAVQFRAPHNEKENWPWVWFENTPSAGQPIIVDGPMVLGTTRYVFRRWSHLRFVGPLEVSAVTLDRRSKGIGMSASAQLLEGPVVEAEKRGAPRTPARSEFETRFMTADRNKDGGLSREELDLAKDLPQIWNNFEAMDANRDGNVTLEERDAWLKANRPAKKRQ